MSEKPDGTSSVWARPVDRKGFVAIGTLAALAAASGGRLTSDALAAMDAAELEGELLYYNWADYVNPKTYGAFTKRTGVRVKKDFFASNEALFAKLKGGARGYDLITPTGYMVQILAQEKLLQRINWAKLPTVKANINEKFRNLPFDRGDRYWWRRTGGRPASCTGATSSASGPRRGASSST